MPGPSPIGVRISWDARCSEQDARSRRRPKPPSSAHNLSNVMPGFGPGIHELILRPPRLRVTPILASLRRHALFRQLLDRALVLREVGKAHAAQHVGGLGELDVVVADDLDAVAPGIAEI